MNGVMALRAAASLSLAMLCATTAQAAFVLTLDDTAGHTITVNDNGVGDSNSDSGVITYSGSLGGSVFNINVTTGVSDPLLGPGVLNLNSINVSSTSGGTLQIQLTDTDFTGPVSAYDSSYGGTTDGSVSIDFRYDTSNAEFGGSSLLNTGAMAGSFSGGSTSSVASADPYSLSIFATIVHGAGNQSSNFGATLQPVPVPAAVWLFGSGLAGLVSVARRRRS